MIAFLALSAVVFAGSVSAVMSRIVDFSPEVDDALVSACRDLSREMGS